MSKPRADASSDLHSDPILNAWQAASTAKSTSASLASWTCASASSVAGLYVGKVLPDFESTNSLLMNNYTQKSRKIKENMFFLFSKKRVNYLGVLNFKIALHFT